ncbi:MAG TPA: pilus assembly protein N-terminal domain-containing protein [Micavibrio sp.]|nr:pilus assembly protein N-terminal domain-containing protein [Micavibrio sp.]
MKKQLFILPAVLLLGAALTLGAQAQPTAQPAQDLMPPVTTQSAATPTEALDSETHPALNLTPDKSELVRLDREASSIVVGNPSHISVLLDAPRLAVVIPRSPGATYFTVLDKDGNVIMQRHVIVAAPKKNYVRVRRSCSGSDGSSNCQPTSVYFCPDMCHEIGSGEGAGASGAIPTVTTE